MCVCVCERQKERERERVVAQKQGGLHTSPSAMEVRG